MKKKILCIIGTRPEVIKMAPIILLLQSQNWVDARIVATAQHRELLDQMLELFHIKQDIDLNIMEPDQTLPDLTIKLLTQLEKIFKTERPDAVIAQGDTNTTFAAALLSFYNQIPFYHVEAGLRSNDITNPFPEEMNRILTDRLSTLLFAPTEDSKKNLVAEGILAHSIFITGNTVIDAMHYISQKNMKHNLELDPSKRIILVTAHRRESFGKPFLEICYSLRQLVNKAKDIQIIFPVHPNPHVSKIAHQQLDGQERILLIPPLHYSAFISLLNQAYLILTDSGGIQEEAPALGKPVLVLRNKTERIEGVKAGVAKIVGVKSSEIVSQTLDLLEHRSKYDAMVKNKILYGDGEAASRIVDIIHRELSKT